MTAIASACQSKMRRCAASSTALPRTAWRSASATRGAVCVGSSPSTSTASQDSISRSEGVRAAPWRSSSSTCASSAVSVASAPIEKFVAPTSWRSAKLLSRLARGEPMPTRRAVRIAAATRSSPPATLADSNSEPARANIWRGRSARFT
ncbi:MAG: hypothetical protein CALGDGBN_01708 [Pseudomonadales bacterium]|nr:hypothetical protein [Pseudomonadales bacterium]